MSDREFELALVAACVAKGDHIPKSWTFPFDDGADGCMPQGWYAIGCDENGLAIVWPTRMEFGPFNTEAEARQEALRMQPSGHDERNEAGSSDGALDGHNLDRASRQCG